MKAIDYAAKLNNMPDFEAFKRQLNANVIEFVAEVRTLADKRGIRTAEGLKPIVRELNQKYMAYVRIVNNAFFKRKAVVTETGFMQMIQRDMPELYQIYTQPTDKKENAGC